MLESGKLQDYVFSTLQPSYGKRFRKMMATIQEELIPLGVRLPQMDREVVGGYFIWLTLPAPLKGAVVAQRAKDEENLVVAPGEMFEVSTAYDARDLYPSLTEGRCPATGNTLISSKI